MAKESGASDLVDKVLAAAGGKDRLIKKYRFVDRLRVGKDEEKLFQPLDDRKPRNSYVDAPGLWWLQKKDKWEERGKEPAKWLAYGWSLAVLDDPKAQFESIPGLVDERTKLDLTGVRVSGSIEPAMDLYFDSETLLLARIDWDDEICRFSDWTPYEGFTLPSRCIGYRRESDEPWYVCEIDLVEPLAEIPEEVISAAQANAKE